MRPTPMYTRMMLGPVSAIDLPEPKNRPVPMVPPMAMNWTWRFFRPRSMSLSLSRLSMDLICAVSVASDVLVPVFPVFVFPKVIMFTPYRANRTISAVVRTAKCAICGRFASFPKNALRRVESACQGFQLATERFVFAFQLVDALSLLFDDDKRRLAVKAAARAERCRRHGDGSRIGWDGHVSGYTPPPTRSPCPADAEHFQCSPYRNWRFLRCRRVSPCASPHEHTG